MSEDRNTWPTIDAASLFLLRGFDVVADEPLEDGTLPLSCGHRMTHREWCLYRAQCAAAGLREIRRLQELEREGCAV